jgi:hypothetical protein
VANISVGKFVVSNVVLATSRFERKNAVFGNSINDATLLATLLARIVAVELSNAVLTSHPSYGSSGHGNVSGSKPVG